MERGIGVEIEVGIVASRFGSNRLRDEHSRTRAYVRASPWRGATYRSGRNERGDTRRDDTRRDETRRDETTRDEAGQRVVRETRRNEARPVERSRVKSSRVESERESVAGDSSGRQVRYVGFVVLSRSLQTTCAAP